ncbi:AGO3 [Cordylochernes scorpioides]|uniref:AGO3 n=1 Tax=Cordylochernes scorpioides TaxID=51811 RepID=A0ABY6JXE4_9ARAC|nr:AGO3 [Cordylochernes scorpioides]
MDRAQDGGEKKHTSGGRRETHRICLIRINPSYCTRSNGRVERANRTLLDKGRTLLATTNETIPKDYEEAIACEDKKHWENAMLEEIQNMYSHQVWELHTYQEALGMLMFLAVNTRPDIAYITSKLSQYSRQPKQMHWTAIKRVMRYLRGTIDLGVKFERGKTGILKSYTDASWSTTHDGKSYGGYVLKLGEATIDWKSSKQPLVALSTMEAEMIAACESCCQIKWIINLLQELEEWNFMENQLRSIQTDLEADIFTKDLSRDQMKKHLESLSIVGIKPKTPYLFHRKDPIGIVHVVQALIIMAILPQLGSIHLSTTSPWDLGLLDSLSYIKEKGEASNGKMLGASSSSHLHSLVNKRILLLYEVAEGEEDLLAWQLLLLAQDLLSDYSLKFWVEKWKKLRKSGKPLPGAPECPLTQQREDWKLLENLDTGIVPPHKPFSLLQGSTLLQDSSLLRVFQPNLRSDQQPLQLVYLLHKPWPHTLGHSQVPSKPTPQFQTPSVPHAQPSVPTIEPESSKAAPNMEYKRYSSCIPGLGVLIGYYQPGQLSPGKIPILRRPDKGGTLGISINLLVNFFQLKHIRDQVYRYDVDLCLLMKSEETKEIYKKEINKKFKRKLFELFRVKCPQLQGCFPVYDGDKMMLTARKLATPTFTFVLDHFENERQQSYQLDVKPIKNGNNVVQLRKVGAGYDHYEAMTAIEVIFRYRPAFEFVPVGRSLFPKPTQPIMLAGGIEMWQGYYLSVQIGTAGAFVNLDRAATAFYPEGPLIRFVYELARSQDWTFIKRNLDRINKFLHHLKVTVTQGVRRSYTVDKLVVETASQKSFRNKENRKLTVEEYYRENYNNCRLRYPEAPLVQMTPNKGFSPFIPLEFCMIKDGQPYRHKLNEDQTSDMIKINAVPPEKRFKEIEQKMIDFSRVIEPLRNAYEIDIDLSPFKLIGRILKPPSIIFHQNRQREIRDGKWDLRGVNFYDPCTINCWLLISFAYERFLGLDRLSHFGKVLVEQARQLGINMKQPEDILFGRSLNFNPQNTNCQAYINFFHDIQNAYRNVDLVVVVLGNKFHKDQHSMVKRACDIQLCIPSQCIKDDNASKARIQLVVNLLQKINTKMGGINSVPRPRQNFKVFNKPCIVMGADVNHPAPGDVITPSIAAVVGSIDSHLFRYVPEVRLQTRNQKFQSRLEIIQDLSKMIKTLLKAYYKTNSQRPQSILFFRDGVSEGQFQEVLRDELSEIKRACADLSKVTDPYNPTITFVVVQKRHHARFKPENPHQSSGKCGNIPPGTTVDTDIIHPHNFDYYQCSHLGIQGTSRPTKYVVLHDENKFTSDEMQEMTNFLCYTFSRCTGSISLVAPAQYAHLVAFRAKEHLSTCDTGTKWTDLGRDNVISKEMLQAITLRDPILRTMYFV